MMVEVRTTVLEAQQRYFSYRAILLAKVSQNSLCLFLWGIGAYRIAQLSCDMSQNGVSHRCACVKLNTKGAIMGERKAPLESIARYGVLQRWYRNIVRYGATKTTVILNSLGNSRHKDPTIKPSSFQRACLAGVSAMNHSRLLAFHKAFSARSCKLTI